MMLSQVNKEEWRGTATAMLGLLLEHQLSEWCPPKGLYSSDGSNPRTDPPFSECSDTNKSTNSPLGVPH